MWRFNLPSVIPNWAAARGKTHLLGGKRTLIVKEVYLRNFWVTRIENRDNQKQKAREEKGKVAERTYQRKKDKEKRQSRKERVTETKSLLTTESQEEKSQKEKVAEIKVTETKSLRIIEWQKDKATERQSDRKKVSEKRVTKKKATDRGTNVLVECGVTKDDLTCGAVVVDGWPGPLTDSCFLWTSWKGKMSRCRPCWNVHGKMGVVSRSLGEIVPWRLLRRDSDTSWYVSLHIREIFFDL